MLGVQTDDSDIAKWRRALGAKGWTAPTWPKQYGGGGLSVAEARVLQDEMRKIGAFQPLGFGMGITVSKMFGTARRWSELALLSPELQVEGRDVL